ncbi:MAG: insulinase family protein [Planctomycetales bacterium]|nr:insulinase family protein [Planctomycetales bacterium]NIM09942.1 insulinase family protein [Planctomycetales bacterium]NIN09382.1 insulinase family protein [Planctomycetales bacterium]NIN78489.1 insulinase family protein [Planctomycetales bacterium]NIO35681.1 insulinase family protein [Planctomycetales bacterium]
MKFRQQQLDNGLQIVAECNPQAYTAAVCFMVRTGARDETPEVAGVSHFLEHMVFKGTPTRSADDVNQRFDDLGAEHNAWTTKEHTAYYAVMLPEYQEEIVELWADVMRPSLREEDFETEKQVIIEEIRMYEDQPPFCADERCEKNFFGSHPLGNSVLGSVETIRNLDVDTMRQYFRARYSPQNMIVAAAGKIDFDNLVGTLQRECGDWEPFEVQRQLVPPQPHDGFEVVQKATATQEYVIELATGPSATDPRRFAAYMLANLLGDGSGSRLYWELLHTGCAEQASLHYYEYDGVGVLGTWLCCEPEDAAENLRRIQEVYRQAEKEGFSEAELARAKMKFNSRMVLASERPQSRMASVGMNWLRRGEYRSVKQDLDEYNAVTLRDVAEVLAEFPLTRHNTIAIGPLADVQPPA